MSNLIFNYPLDLTGTAATNRVVGEEYLIGPIRGRIFVPRGGPFYGNSVSLVDLETNRPLVPREDFYLLHYYEEAVDRSDQPVYAVVRIVNPEVSTRIAFTANYIGGEFSYSYYAIANAVRTLETDGRPVNWGDLVGTPSEYNPAPHLHDIRNSYNWNSVVDALSRIETAILTGNTASMSLLVETLDAKLRIMDQYRVDTDQLIAQLRADIDSRFTAYDVTVNQYFTNFRDNLKTYLRPTAIKTSSITVGINRTYTVFPGSVNAVEFETTVTIPSTATPADGDYIEFYPARDGCTLNINAVNAAVCYLNAGALVNSNTVTGIKLDRAGVKLIWDVRSGTWSLSRSIDPKTSPIDAYDLKVVTTTGAIDLSAANAFILSAGSNRMVTLNNVTQGRGKPVAILVKGSGSVMWPTIKWANGQTPQLGAVSTLINLIYIDNTWIGTWMEPI